VIAAIHRDYAAAGATVHTANTFRTKRRTVGDRWEQLARAAVQLARNTVPSAHRIAGSIAPLEDCYRPDLSPADSRAEHRELAEVLADTGCDVLLCETFAHCGEAIVAVEEAVRTGIETWLALTAGPSADLMTAEQMSATAAIAIEKGASAVLVNCTPVNATFPYVQRLCRQFPGIVVGAYANAGDVNDRMGWTSDANLGAEKYAQIARSWVGVGASLIGGCCGTGPQHIRAVSALGGRLLENG
jgi:S-methylmethionine-dependent homocysteine/selenocysteine methylase